MERKRRGASRQGNDLQILAFGKAFADVVGIVDGDKKGVADWIDSGAVRWCARQPVGGQRGEGGRVVGDGETDRARGLQRVGDGDDDQVSAAGDGTRKGPGMQFIHLGESRCVENFDMVNSGTALGADEAV